MIKENTDGTLRDDRNEYSAQGNASVVSKVDRYKWYMTDKPGEFMMIGVEDLFIAPEYQRNIQATEIARIASAWLWAACGALIVMLRGDTFYIVDGQQRWMAAKRRGDIKQLPCMVYEAKDNIKCEADAFTKINEGRKGLTGLEKFKGHLTSEDDTAVKINRLLQKYGLAVGGSPSSKICSCVQTMMALCSEDEPLFLKVFDLAVKIHAGEAIHGHIIKGLFTAEKYLVRIDFSESVFSQYVSEKLISAGRAGILKSINNATAYYNKGGQTVMAQGIIELINTKRKDLNRIPNIF
jgi:hypothetical protein